ncbi:MAG: PAS domain-containing protein [Myxococcales bacterium]|nr:PAS domain-containing protein [Myxococcales bacterium]
MDYELVDVQLQSTLAIALGHNQVPVAAPLVTAVLDALPHGLVVVDCRGTVLYVNQVAQRLNVHKKLPATRDLWADLWGTMSAFDILGLDLRGRTFVERVVDGEVFDDDVRFFRPEPGSLGRWVAGSARPLVDSYGCRIGGLLTLREVTEQREARQALATSEERYRQMMSHIEEGVWVFCLTGRRMIYVNPGFERLFNVDAKAVYQNPKVWMASVHSDDRTNVEAFRDSACSSGETAYRIQCGTRIRWVRDRLYPVRDIRGEPHQVVGVVSEFTELYDTHRRLVGVNQALERSNQDLEKLAYQTSHDLSEPLRAVCGYIELLRDECAEQISSAGQMYLRLAFDGAGRLRRSVDGIFQHARLNGEKLVRVSVHLEKLVERVLSDYAVILRERKADIEVTKPLPTVESDESLLERALGNLVANAVKYGGDGSPRIRIEAERNNEYWSLSVRDWGPGISEGNMHRILRLDGSCHRDLPEKGLGLGLMTVKRIAKLHQGELLVVSAEGEGSRFTLCVPREGRVIVTG